MTGAQRKNRERERDREEDKTGKTKSGRPRLRWLRKLRKF
jgi:hypothetical protein